MRKLLILISAVALVVTFTLPAAADVSFYGNVRMSTFWVDDDPGTVGADSDTVIDWDLDAANSRFGAKFKQGDVAGNVEIRPNSASYFRQWNGTWNYGGGKLLIGQAWSPAFIGSACGECYDGGIMGGYGGMNGSLRIPQVALHMGSLKLAFEKPNTTNVLGLGSGKNTMPKIEASYGLNAGPVAITLIGGYNMCEEEDAAKKTYDVNSYLFGGKWKIGFGAATLQGVLWTAKNPKEYAQVSSKAMATTITTDVNDVDSMGGTLAFNYKISSMYSFEVGVGTATHELDTPGTNESTYTAMFANLPITLAKGVKLTPEIAVFSGEIDTGAAVKTEPEKTVFGAYWYIAF